MPLLNSMDVKQGRFARRLLVCLAMGSLVLALASRTFHVSSTVQSVVQQQAQSAKARHLSNDAHQWTGPQPSLVLHAVWLATDGVLNSQSQDLTADHDYRIYCRPPPAC